MVCNILRNDREIEIVNAHYIQKLAEIWMVFFPVSLKWLLKRIFYPSYFKCPQNMFTFLKKISLPEVLVLFFLTFFPVGLSQY